MGGTALALQRRLRDPEFMQTYFRGDALDIGPGRDPLSHYLTLFPRLASVQRWELVPDGDAGVLHGVLPQSFDLVYASHVLEHLEHPLCAVHRWAEVLRPGGHMVVVVPDEEMYEHGIWPSFYNKDHKHSFTLRGRAPLIEDSISVPRLASLLCEESPHPLQLCRLQRLEAAYIPSLGSGVDQTATVGECGIEFVVRRLPEPREVS